MAIKITIVCENTVGRSIPAIGEHGFACWLEIDGSHYLVDTGQGLGLMNNIQVLGLPLEQLSGVVISHGHYDHAGGLDQLLKRRGQINVYAHPDIFVPRFAQGGKRLRFLGIPQRRELLEALGADFVFTPDFQQIAPNLYASGSVPRRTDFEHGDSNLVQRDAAGNLVPDPFNDDMAVAMDTPRGLVVVLGCAHSGIVNTLDYFCQKFNRKHIYAVVGGTHLGPVSEAQFHATLVALKRFDIQKLGVSHCTGQARAAQLRNEYGAKFFFGSVGAVLAIE
ncbi:MAG: MBL fold metallo-hydrolase [Desulfuromonas sp.]|nr:MBL fold metallo-hydrolase [Desulfuromonas sp.]